MKKYALEKITFATCGLNAENNFLQAPICPCGCGEYASLILNTKRDLYNFMETLLEEHDCDYCAIFALCNDESHAFVVKADGTIAHCQANSSYDEVMKTIAHLQEEIQFHCYGLLVQVDTDLYKIVMD